MDELSAIIFDDAIGPETRKARLKEWIEENESKAPDTTGYVERDLDGIQNVEEHPSLFEVMTTSRRERQMVEVTKRFDNGGRGGPNPVRALCSGTIYCG